MGVLACIAALALTVQETPAESGATLTVGGRRVTVRSTDFLPFVDNEYTKVFVFEKSDNPKLKELREKNGLDEIVGKGKDEFDRQVLLLDWVNRRIKKFGRPTASPKGALEVLKAVTNANDGFNLYERGIRGSGVFVLEPGEERSATFVLKLES